MKSSDIDQDLFTDSYCKVCSAQLISESQRVAHYEVRRAFPTRTGNLIYSFAPPSMYTLFAKIA
uniref:Zinc finger matrin-type 4 n=1 Tax=Ursus americanus TaxID=9643 RepID=A0A452R229_URSAM